MINSLLSLASAILFLNGLEAMQRKETYVTAINMLAALMVFVIAFLV